MAPPLPLAHDATVAQLTQWLTEWSLLYSFAYDRKIREVLMPPSACFTSSELKIIFDWKLGNQWKAAAVTQVDNYDLAHPGEIQRKTGNASSAQDDAQALANLRGLPQVRSSQVAAVGTAILMCLNPWRWTVMDVNSNAALVCLRNTIQSQSNNPSDPLHDLAVQLAVYAPRANARGNYAATAADWPSYVAICRAMARETLLSLRSIDRALQRARNWC